MTSSPVYYGKKNNKGGKPPEPAMYLNLIYSTGRPAQDGNEAREGYMANFDVPGQDEPLTLKELGENSITCVPTIKLMRVTKHAKGLTLKLYITEACVTDLSEINVTKSKSKTYERYSQNAALVEKMKRKRQFTPKRQEEEHEKEDAPRESPTVEAYERDTEDENNEDGGDDFNLESIINNDNDPFDN